MKTFRLCCFNKQIYDDAPYEKFVETEDDVTLDDVWKKEHNNYELGHIVTITEVGSWKEKRFYK